VVLNLTLDYLELFSISLDLKTPLLWLAYLFNVSLEKFIFLGAESIDIIL
jgi:hypothetical protein